MKESQGLVQVEFVNDQGMPVNLYAHPPKPRPRRDDLAGYHKGWVVVGHPPGACEAAKIRHEAAQRFYLDLAPSDRKGLRDPGLWSEAAWRRTRKTRLRKPFEIESSAEEMAALACKSGWEDVEVIQLLREERA
jgi:hypothetical protein